MKNCLRSSLFTLFGLVFLLSLSPDVIAQKGVKAFGVQFKPLLPLGLVNSGEQSITDAENNTTLNFRQTGGYNIGAVIRFGLSKRWSLETGINYIRRNYSFDLNSPSFPASSSDLYFSGYEIPLQAMVWVRLDQQLYMNSSLGLVADLFPTGGVATYDRDTIEYGMLETSWIVPAMTANLGFEYRTEKMGFFYLGASFHQPLQDMAELYVSYFKPNTTTFVRLIDPPPGVSGTYLTLDLRYFFNSGMKVKPEK